MGFEEGFIKLVKSVGYPVDVVKRYLVERFVDFSSEGPVIHFQYRGTYFGGAIARLNGGDCQGKGHVILVVDHVCERKSLEDSGETKFLVKRRVMEGVEIDCDLSKKLDELFSEMHFSS